jgi:alkanesulfonate monooxygenase SsuD/methylene tetrahydromethanopterin reductase-like flavin-dependent oxidoreductase (luciferase family)
VIGGRQLEGVGFALRDPLPWSQFAGLAVAGEALGYAAVFLPEIAGRDTLVALGALAGETERLRLGTGIVPMRSRSPALLSMAAATVQERSAGRLILGVGTGPATPGALNDLRELVNGLRTVLSGGAADLGHGPALLTLDPGWPIPIWIAALGPRAVRVAGEVADGVLLNWCTPERVAEAREALHASALAAGRDPSSVTVAAYVRASLAVEERSAVHAAAAAVAEYASFPAYARQFRTMGLGDAAERAAGDPDGASSELIRAVCLIGDPAVARRRLDAYREAGADLVVVYPLALPADPMGSVRATLEALAPDASV